MNWIILVAGLFNFGLGVFVWLKNRKSRLNTRFALFAMTAGILCFFDYIFRYYPSVETVRICYAIATFLPGFAVLWVYELSDRKLSLPMFFLLFFSGGILFVTTLTTDLIIRKIHFLTLLGYRGEVGPFFPFYSLYILTIIIYVIVTLYLARKKARSLKKTQLTHILFGLVLYGIFASVFSLILPSFFNNYVFTLMDAPASLFFVAFSSYAIVRYRFMGIRMIVSRIYIYLAIAFFGYAFFYSAIFVQEYLFGSIYNFDALIFAPILAIIFAVAFIPFFREVQKSSDVIFFRGYNPREILKDLGLKLSSVIDLDELLKILTEEFKKILATDEIDVFLSNNESAGEKIYVSALRGSNKKLLSSGVICRAILADKQIVVRDEMERLGKKSMVKELDRLKAKTVAPLVLRSKFIGLIVLGEKISQDAYTQEDFEFLEIISSQAAVAIENARLYQEIEDFNKTLQQKVDEQTKDIKEKTERLRKLLEMRSEFLDITSHQLRTPVSVIKGVLSMINEGSLPPKKRKEFIRGALEKSIKLGEIINDILRASEMDSDRFRLNLKPIQLEPVLKKIAKDKEQTMEIKKVKLTMKLPREPLPPVLADERYLEQAIVNLINNSFQYTLKGLITVEVSKEKQAVKIKVIDTGIGIPEKDRPKLFQKFGRAENAIAVYADGSGLGLFIVKQIVDATPGAKVYIEKTEVNKGTTFVLVLPIAKAVAAETGRPAIALVATKKT